MLITLVFMVAVVWIVGLVALWRDRRPSDRDTWIDTLILIFWLPFLIFALTWAVFQEALNPHDRDR